MDLGIAYIKYTRGLLMNSQLPVVATQALMDGYKSTSLVLLASEYDPMMADIAPLFEATMRELNIQLPSDSKSSGMKFSEPMSTESPKFIEPVLKALEQNHELIVQQRFAYTAGAGAGWHLIRGVSEWQELLASGKNKTAYTVILEKELPLRGTANDELQSESIKLFDRLGDLMIGVFIEGDSYFPLYSFVWDTRASRPKDAEKDLAKTKEKINQLFEKHRGRQFAVGRDLWIWDEDIAQVTGYIPDEDGVARRGAY